MDKPAQPAAPDRGPRRVHGPLVAALILLWLAVSSSALWVAHAADLSAGICRSRGP